MLPFGVDWAHRAQSKVRKMHPMNSPKLMPRLQPGLPVLTRSQSEIQLGLNPLTSIRFPIEFKPVLSRCDGATEFAEILELASALNFDVESTKNVISNLIGTNALVLETPDLGEISTNQKSHLLDAQRATQNNAEAVSKRTNCRIEIYGLGRIGMTISLLLGNSGFSNLRLVDAQPVTNTDLLPWGASRIDLGTRRDNVAETLLSRIHREQTRKPNYRDSRQDTSLIIYVTDPNSDFPFFEPDLADEATAHDIPYLIIGASSTISTVSSVLIPGESGCVRCLHLSQTDRDSAWPVLVAQLVGREIPDLTPTALVLRTALFAYQRISNWVELKQNEANTWWQLTEQSESSFINYPHQNCGCNGLTEAA